MNIVYVFTQKLLQDCVQDTFFLNVLTVLCIYQFPEIFPENISKIFIPTSCCFIEDKKKIKLKTNPKYSSRKRMAVDILIGIQTQKMGSSCWFTSVPPQS